MKVIKSVSAEVQPKPALEILRYSELDAAVQEVALQRIQQINAVTSTDGLYTWDQHGYTEKIRERVSYPLNEDARNNLILARVENIFVGYVAFYSRNDNVPYPKKFIEREREIYCSWTGVDPEYRGRNMAMLLKEKIMEEGFDSFRGHIKETNESSLRVLDKFAEKGYLVEKKLEGKQWLYRVAKS